MCVCLSIMLCFHITVMAFGIVSIDLLNTKGTKFRIPPICTCSYCKTKQSLGGMLKCCDLNLPLSMYI